MEQVILSSAMVLKNQIIFDEIYGSEETNLVGVNKLNFILNKWGPNFAYVGNSNDDIPIFKSSNNFNPIDVSFSATSNLSTVAF